MKKVINKLKQKTIKELEQEVNNLRQEIAKLKIETKVNPPKDTNFLVKKRKKLAQLLTILTEKKEAEKLKVK